MATLSLSEVATVLGKSERQVRYMIKHERLKATKVVGRWVVQSTDLPITDDQREALSRRVDAARAAFDKGVAATDKATGSDTKRRYSVMDLDAFTLALTLYRDVTAAKGHETAAGHLLECLRELATGCHAFHPREKADHFASARRQAAAALVLLLLSGTEEEPVPALAERLEQQVIPKVSSLIAGQERRRRKG